MGHTVQVDGLGGTGRFRGQRIKVVDVAGSRFLKDKADSGRREKRTKGPPLVVGRAGVKRGVERNYLLFWVRDSPLGYGIEGPDRFYGVTREFYPDRKPEVKRKDVHDAAANGK
ncbi:MAG: hypothetical protein ACE5GH_00390 [Fidelibacterota bacterium]